MVPGVIMPTLYGVVSYPLKLGLCLGPCFTAKLLLK